MHGSNSVYIPPVYGTKGVANAANTPGSRHRSTSWTDNSGKFWLFGGSNNKYFNDLWMYDPSTNMWTWISGDNTINNTGVYGTQSVSSPLNKPGGRYAALSWADNSGNLYMFGGFGYGTGAMPQFLNDFWKYSIATNEWTWLSGDNTINNTGVYGTKGTAASSNKPGSRYGSASWKDVAGNLWMMGGKGYGEFLAGDLNDVWKYSPSSNEWTWINGDKTVDNPGIYDGKNVASASNKPGSRNLCASWVDASGNCWMFGGEGYASSGSKGNLNDLWKYDATANVWTWVSGDAFINAPNVYGTKGIGDPANVPGGRQGMNGWIDNNGVFWIFGGYQSGVAQFYNDLWAFDPVSNEWTWLSGSSSINQPGTYGTMGVSSPTNMPGARFVTGSWTDASGYHWIYGGTGYSAGSIGFMNDLWKLKGCIVSGKIMPYSTAICPGGSQLLTASGGVSYQWLFNGSPISGAISSSYNAMQTGKYSVIISNGECSAPAHNDAVITSKNVPMPSANFEAKDICVNQLLSFINSTPVTTDSASYMWEFGDNTWSTEVNPSHTYSQADDFNVMLIASSKTCPNMKDTAVKQISIRQPLAGTRYSNILVAKNQPLTLQARSIGTAYEWQPPGYLSDAKSATPVLQTDRNVEYTIKITDQYNCVTVDTLLVLISGKTQVSVPNAFTANNDGKNDVLKPILINVANITFTVFNRLGQVVYRSTDVSNTGWDGRLNGQLQPEGTYVWMIVGKDYEGNAIKAKGTVILIR